MFPKKESDLSIIFDHYDIFFLNLYFFHSFAINEVLFKGILFHH